MAIKKKPKPRRFRWDKRKQTACLELAAGNTIKEAAKSAEVTERTVRRWKQVPEFQVELDRLIVITDIGSRAQRILIAKQVVKQRMKNEVIETDKDLLDWLKYVQSETDGIKLGLSQQFLAAITNNDQPDPGSGQD